MGVLINCLYFKILTCAFVEGHVLRYVHYSVHLCMLPAENKE